MKNLNDVLFFTQARLNSQRLHHKMINDFCGTTLWDIACQKLERINVPTHQKWVSVYEDELKDIAAKYKVNKYFRSKESADAETEVNKIWEICCQFDYEYYVMFNPCLPLLSVNTIQEFIDYFIYTNSPSLFGVVKVKDYFWNEDEELFFPPGATMFNTKLCPHLLKASHSLYAGRVDDLRNNIQLGDFSKNNPELFILNNKIENLDIDDKEDWEIAESVYNQLIKR